MDTHCGISLAFYLQSFHGQRKMSLLYPVDPVWHLSIRSLIRQNFRDKYPTRDIDWSKSAAIIQECSPKLVGACIVEETGLLRYLVVKEEFRGRGYGSLLLKTCLEHITHLTCMTNRISFYEKHGFQVEGPAAIQEMFTMTKQNGKIKEIDEGSKP